MVLRDGGGHPLEGGGGGGGGREGLHGVVGGEEGVMPEDGGALGGGLGLGRGGGGGVVVADLGQPLDLEALGHLEEAVEVLLVDGDLAAVHELEQGLHLLVADVAEEDDGVPVGGVVQHGLEVGRAGREHHLVRLQLHPLHGEGDVDEGLGVEEVLEHGEQVVLVVVPPEAVLLGEVQAGLAAAGRALRGRGRAGRGVHLGLL